MNKDQLFAKTISILWNLTDEEWIRYHYVNNYRIIWRSLSVQPIEKPILNIEILKKEPSKELKAAFSIKEKYQNFL